MKVNENIPCYHSHIAEIDDRLFCAKCGRPEHVSVTDTAKEIRKALKAAFPDTKFSVKSKSYSGGASVSVYYVDGPPTAAVDRIARPFSGASFDGMIDLKSYHSSVYNGKPVHWGADYVFVNRSYSGETITNEFGRSVSNPDGPFQRVERLLRQHGDCLSNRVHQVLSTADLRWETLERAVERYMCENVAGYIR